jgi:hypothetical protein
MSKSDALVIARSVFGPAARVQFDDTAPMTTERDTAKALRAQLDDEFLRTKGWKELHPEDSEVKRAAWKAARRARTDWKCVIGEVDSIAFFVCGKGDTWEQAFVDAYDTIPLDGRFKSKYDAQRAALKKLVIDKLDRQALTNAGFLGHTVSVVTDSKHYPGRSTSLQTCDLESAKKYAKECSVKEHARIYVAHGKQWIEYKADITEKPAVAQTTKKVKLTRDELIQRIKAGQARRKAAKSGKAN